LENRFGTQLWGAVPGKSFGQFSEPTLRQLRVTFKTQFWGVAFGSNFGEQLSGVALKNSFGE